MSWQTPPRPGSPVLPQSDYPVPAHTSVRTQLLVALAIGAVFGLFVYIAQAPVSRALGAGLVFAVGSFSALRALDLGWIEWPTPPNGRAAALAGKARWRLNGFDALTDSRPGLSPDLRSRLRALAAAILARHELTAGSPGAIELLGAGTHELLFAQPRAGTDPLPPDPTAAQLTAMVDRLIALGDSRRRPGLGAAPPPDEPFQRAPTIEREGNR